MAAASKHSRSRFTLIILAGLFVTPIILAFILYYQGGISWQSEVNHGVLIVPPVKLAKLKLMDTHGLTIEPERLRGK